MYSFQGQFLVAARHQHDPNFVETVILVVEHSDQGAFGVIVNCPRTTPQIPRTEQPLSGKARLYFGGPVTGPLMAVHDDASFAEHEILPGVFFAGKEENVVPLMRQTKQPCKVFTGYAGWEPGQLEYEIEQRVWRVVPGTAERIFSKSDELWEELSKEVMERQLREMFNVKHIPADPQWN